MNIEQMISLINVTDVRFISQVSRVREKGQLSIYSTKDGVCYWKDESIWSIGSDENCKSEIWKIRQKMIRQVDGLDSDDRELDKYVAVYELLKAIDEYKGGERSGKVSTIKKYVEIINKEILESLDFQKIPGMKNLEQIIKTDKLYSQMMFNVHEVHSTKDRQFSGNKPEAIDYSFGNIKYCEKLDKVNITLFDDCVELTCLKEARERYSKPIDKRDDTPEKKIMTALDCWRCSWDGYC